MKLSPRLLFIFGLITIIAIGVIIIVLHSQLLNIFASTAQPEERERNTVSENSKIPPTDAKLTTPISIPIFMYHYIRDYQNPDDSIGNSLSVSPNTFSNEIKGLKKSGYKTVSFSQYLAGKFDKNSIIITFDDGYGDAYQGYLTLIENNFIGIFYLIANKIDTPGYLTTSQIKEMTQSGMVVGSHTLSHPNLTSITAERARSEIFESKTRLESIIESSVIDFCYPAGKYNQATIELVQEAGYKTAVTTRSPQKNIFNDFFTLPRFRATPSGTPELLVNQIISLND